MKNISRRRQSGMTALGIFIILCMCGCFVAFGFRIFPLFNMHMSVKSSMEATLSQPYQKINSTKKLRVAFLKSARVNSLFNVDRQNIKDILTVVKSEDGKKYMNIKIEDKKPLFKNYFILIDIDESMEIPTGDKK
jgi:Domain of unknown function (DUF4845)